MRTCNCPCVPIVSAKTIAEAELMLDTSQSACELIDKDNKDWIIASEELTQRLGTDPAQCIGGGTAMISSGAAPAIVLVDLGLPYYENDEIRLDAGLDLIREFQRDRRRVVERSRTNLK